MIAKIVCRLFDAEGRMLGWGEHYAAIPGDGTLRADGPVQIYVERDGLPTTVSLHWTDVNVETRIPCPAVRVKGGEMLTVFAPGEPVIRLGVPPVGLPAVTVGRPVTVGVPVGQMGSRG